MGAAAVTCPERSRRGWPARWRRRVVPTRSFAERIHDPPAQPDDLLRRTKAAPVSAARYLVGFHLVGPPAAGTGRCAARTVQNPLLRCPCHQRHKIRPIRVRTEAYQVARPALRTFHAMTDTPSHHRPTIIPKVANLRPQRRTETDVHARRWMFSDGNAPTPSWSENVQNFS